MSCFVSVTAFQSCINKIRNYNEGYVTNYFVSLEKTQSWINDGLLSYERVGKTFFVVRLNNGFSNLYYISTSAEQLFVDMQAFSEHLKDDTLVLDVLGKSAEVENLLPAFTSQGFKVYTALTRMSRQVAESRHKGKKDSPFIDSHAKVENVSYIAGLFEAYFDIYAEQIPLKEELLRWIEKGQIIVAGRTDKEIAAFLIYEMNGKTGYLRYWFVHPDFREMKIGSLLLNRFFELCKESTRQLFWVIESNENAIKRYEHFGFRKEDMKDFVLINKQLTYAG